MYINEYEIYLNFFIVRGAYMEQTKEDRIQESR